MRHTKEQIIKQKEKISTKLSKQDILDIRSSKLYVRDLLKIYHIGFKRLKEIINAK